ncbi:DUF4181 domain-containing protein [Ornithinibacillus salinisoli]|uniref:DUF4181 domain-containing protein n=1 Tax=Ornithinibacillus salinisoli TaxID=1848459 RepID=A0ABW4VYS4_9BACI
MFNFFLLFILLVVILTSILAYYIREKYTYYTSHRYPPINNTKKWVDRILQLLMVFNIIGAFVFSNTEIYLIIFIVLVIIQNGFSAYVEYKHEREENEYMISLVWMIGSLIILVGFMFFTFPTTTFDEVMQKYESFNPELIEQLEIENDTWNEDEITYYPATIIEDKQIIDQIFSELSKVEVRNNLFGYEKRADHYSLNIRNREFYYIAVYENYLTIDSEDYRVVGENYLYKLLEESEIDWDNFD